MRIATDERSHACLAIACLVEEVDELYFQLAVIAGADAFDLLSQRHGQESSQGRAHRQGAPIIFIDFT